ncbi:MAG: ABC transporter permease [Gemmatimonadota bacterium]|nr:MAG: ABC transporter permease [Gemmatimonadota bacterium]
MRRLPAFPEFLLRLLLPGDWRDSILQEIEQAYLLDAETRGSYFAKRTLWREIVSLHWLRLRIEARKLRPWQQRSRLAGWPTPVGSLLKDAQYAARLLRHSPGFTLTAVLTLALGIGANSAIFSVVNGVLLRPLPFPAANQLVYIWDRLDWIGFPRASVSGPQIHDLREQAHTFEGFASLRTATAQLSGTGEPEQLSAAYASANVFDLLGVNAAPGRTFLAGDDAPEAGDIVVISDGLWRRRFGSDPEVIGSTVTLDGKPTTVTGVLPRGFNFQVHHSLSKPSGAEVWFPDKIDLASAPRGQHRFAVLARIVPGATIEQARAELAALGERQDAEWYGDNGFTFTAIPVHEDLVKHVRPTLLLLLSAVGFLLLIATANIATLMLARAQLRGREVAVRSALGASRSRIMWLMFMEGALLAGLGGALGFVMAAFGLDALIALAPESLPRSAAIAIDGQIFAFTGAVVLATAVLCGLAPAFQSSGVKLTISLREGGRSLTGVARATRARNVIVVAEVALSLMLLTGAGLLVRSLGLMVRSDPGFAAEQVIAFDVALPRSRYEDGLARTQFFETLLERVRSLPGVESAGATGTLPLGYLNRKLSDCVPDVLAEGEEAPMVDYMPVTPGYFTTMGIDLIAGRTFTAQDDERDEAPFVTVIDEKLARHWPDGAAVGRQVEMLGESWTVVGVVRHARILHVYEDDRPQLYAPHAQLPFAEMTVALKTATAPAALVPSVRSALGQIDPRQPISNVRTMHSLTRNSTAKQRFATTLMTVFALTGLLLAVLGVYGVLTYSVASRTREIGIRVALGAKQAGIVRLVVRQGMMVTGAGVAIGLIGAFGLSRLMESMVYGISSADTATFVAALLILVAVAALACFAPAWRASAVDPLKVLREE